MSHAEKTMVDFRLLIALPVLAMMLFVPDAAQARKSDRDQEVNMSASGLVTALAQDGDTKLTDLVITQGTLRIEAVSGTVTRTKGDFSRIVLEGTPAVMQQENDDGVPMKAQAQRIVYLPQADMVTLTGQVAIDQGQDSFRGESVTYDIGSGRMKADGGTGRIQMTIQPRKKPSSGDGD
ncbi:MAG: lipopolysaccharide transport periplasmic protein LptA [Lysobacteraceae bacterium]